MRLAPLAAGVAALVLTAPAAHADLPFDLRPILVSEIDLRIHSAKELEGEDGFAVNRLRFGARASFTPWFSAAAQVEVVGESPRILDASLTVKPTPEWEFSFGAGKTPLFSSARDEPVWSLPVPNLSMVTRAFWAGYDAGFEVHRLPTRRVPLEGWLRVGNGSGNALGNDNSSYALDARLDAAFGRALVGASASERFGLRFGVGVHLESAEDRLGISGTTSDGFLFYRPPTVSGPRHVVEGHLVAYAGPVKLTAEGALAKEGRSKDTDGNPETPRVAQDAVVSRGGAVEVGWMIFGPWRVHGSWPVQTPVQTWDWGALELAGRVERLGLGMRARDVTAGGATAASIAVRWWATSFAALSAATYFTAYDAPPIEEPDRASAWLGIVRATVRLPY
jgi:phosphate-selective porin OprO/OprP